jgi:hypothetical protein
VGAAVARQQAAEEGLQKKEQGLTDSDPTEHISSIMEIENHTQLELYKLEDKMHKGGGTAKRRRNIAREDEGPTNNT